MSCRYMRNSREAVCLLKKASTIAISWSLLSMHRFRHLRVKIFIQIFLIVLHGYAMELQRIILFAMEIKERRRT